MFDLPYRPCVGIMLTNQHSKVFVAKRLDGPANAWQMPQGGVDEGEKLYRAALRELEEETGITPDLVEYLAKVDDWLYYDLPEELVQNLWSGRFRGQKQRWYLFRFKGTDNQVNIHTDHPEFSTWKWVPIEELVDAIVPFKRHIYQRVIQEFQPYFASAK